MNRPYIVVQVSASADGRMALGPNRTQWEEMDDPRNKVSGGLDDVWAEVGNRIEQIHSPQAEMQGSGSFAKEGDELDLLPAFEGDTESLYEDFLPDEIVHRPDHKKWLVVVDGRGRMRSGYKGEESSGRYMLHLVSYDAPVEYLAFLQRERIPYLIAGDRRVDLRKTMEKFKAKLDVKCLVSMAGGRLNGALLRARLVDEVNIIFTPRLIGGFETPSLFDSPDLGADEWPTELEMISAQVRTDGVLWVRYRTILRE